MAAILPTPIGLTPPGRAIGAPFGAGAAGIAGFGGCCVVPPFGNAGPPRPCWLIWALLFLACRQRCGIPPPPSSPDYQTQRRPQAAVRQGQIGALYSPHEPPHATRIPHHILPFRRWAGDRRPRP